MSVIRMEQLVDCGEVSIKSNMESGGKTCNNNMFNFSNNVLFEDMSNFGGRGLSYPLYIRTLF